jgi:gliding motility-associated-like protein
MSNGVCPDDSSLVTVVIYPLPIITIASAEELTCSNTTVSLDGDGSSASPHDLIQWSGPGIVLDGNEQTLHPNVDKPGSYILSITNTMTGCRQEDSVMVTQNADTPSSALINAQDPSCYGNQDGSIGIEEIVGGTPPYLFSFNHGAFGNTNVISGLPASLYVIEIEDANGCRWDSVITLQEPAEIILDAGPDIELELGDQANIELFTNLTLAEMDTLIWTPAGLVECVDAPCLNVMVNTFQTATLTATLFDIQGCSTSDAVTIQVKGRKDVYIPTAFSPNDDGINDRFFIMGSEKQISHIRKFQVYTRWGELIHAAYNFEPNDVSSGWDGRFHLEKLNPGVFVYAAEVEYIDGLVVVLTGDVTILR